MCFLIRKPAISVILRPFSSLPSDFLADFYSKFSHFFRFWPLKLTLSYKKTPKMPEKQFVKGFGGVGAILRYQVCAFFRPFLTIFWLFIIKNLIFLLVNLKKKQFKNN
jgi:hypothetical protein